jgi:P27 family predicted phage terminase small subunit
MTTGRKPKPTHLKLVTGNPGKRALPQGEAKVAPSLPDPPQHLSGDAREEWERVSVALFNAGLLSAIDRTALAAYCQAYGRWAQAERGIALMAQTDKVTGGLLARTTNGNAIQNPLVGVANKAMQDMVRYAAEFGMTPSARSRINADPPAENADPTAAYF